MHCCEKKLYSNEEHLHNLSKILDGKYKTIVLNYEPGLLTKMKTINEVFLKFAKAKFAKITNHINEINYN